MGCGSSRPHNRTAFFKGAPDRKPAPKLKVYVHSDTDEEIRQKRPLPRRISYDNYFHTFLHRKKPFKSKGKTPFRLHRSYSR